MRMSTATRHRIRVEVSQGDDNVWLWEWLCMTVWQGPFSLANFSWKHAELHATVCFASVFVKVSLVFTCFYWGMQEVECSTFAQSSASWHKMATAQWHQRMIQRRTCCTSGCLKMCKWNIVELYGTIWNYKRLFNIVHRSCASLLPLGFERKCRTCAM